MNLKIKLDIGDTFIGHGRNKKILRDIIEGLNSGAISVPIPNNSKTQYVCFRLNESEFNELYEISDKNKVTMAELLRESLRQLNLIVPVKK